MSAEAQEVAELRCWIRDYTPRLLAVAEAYASGPVEAEDLLQEVWVRAFTHAPGRSPGVPLLAWLTVVTINAGRDHRRRVRRREQLQRLAAPFALTTIRPVPMPGLHPRSRLWFAVGQLPALQREVVILRIVEGLSTAEVARVLGRAEGTVKASLSRALASLRRNPSIGPDAQSNLLIPDLRRSDGRA